MLFNDEGDLQLSKLARNGSFEKDSIYTLSDFRNLVSYGQLLGIDIIPEIDFPAHTK